MFFACLMYGYMPGMATVGMSASVIENHLEKQQAETGSSGHGSHVKIVVYDANSASDPCPHKKSMTHAPFCAACLVLLPELVFAEKGQPPHGAPLPERQRAFVGNLPAPPLPPPRA